MEAAVVGFAVTTVAEEASLQECRLGVVVFLKRSVSDVVILISNPCVVVEGVTVVMCFGVFLWLLVVLVLAVMAVGKCG